MSDTFTAGEGLMWETLFGRLLGWIPGLWSVRLQREASARICTYGHIGIFFAGGDTPLPQSPPHIDVQLKLWNRGDKKTTLHEITGARAADQPLAPRFRKSVTLEPGDPPHEISVVLRPPKDNPLQAQPGDSVEFRLGLTRGRAREVRVIIDHKKT